MNRRYELVDRVKDTVFKEERYKGKDVGTVTIFQWDVRIATNVTKGDGNRAIGTRLAEDVYDQVLENGRPWQDRAFVVKDWYITAYDPIRDVDDKIIGILYVGILEEKYRDLRNEIVLAFLGVTLLGAVLVLYISYLLARHLTRPIQNLVERMHAISAGDLTHRVEETERDDEIGGLTRAFNTMAVKLREREEQLRVSNSELQALNRNYLDMLGFVSHELQNPLSSCILNAYSMKDGILGEIAPSQKKAVISIVRNLEYFQDMIKNYLDLSRIEEGELRVEKRRLRLYADVVEPTLQGYEREIEERRVRIECGFASADVVLNGDPHLLRIVYDNLVGNALKYGREGGRIVLGAFDQEDGRLLLNVYNEGPGVPRHQIDKLFKKFSRIENFRAPKKKGTGLGLFITQEVIMKHGGRIWVETEEGKGVDFKFVLPRSSGG